MTTHSYARVTWALTVAAFASSSPCQPVQAQAPIPQEALLNAAREIMTAAQYCALSTARDSGAPSIREMDPFPPDEGMNVWLGTNRNSRKIREIEGNPEVSLFYAAPGGRGYVTISGRALLVDDEKEKESRWKPAWDAFYADRVSEFILIKVVPERLEVLDFRNGIAGDPATWEAPSIQFK